MQQTELSTFVEVTPRGDGAAILSTASGVAAAESLVNEQPCPTCGGTMNFNGPEPSGFVYALGRIQPRFPSLELEKEFAQATGRAETANLTNRQALQVVLLQPQNRYLARELCWVLTIEGMEAYILIPRDPADLTLLLEALRPTPEPADVDVVIGIRGPLASPELCNGLIAPVVLFDQIYSFDRDTLVQSIPKPEQMADDQFQSMAAELLDYMMQLADNAGATDEHRALNYLAVRYPAIYATAAEAIGRNFSLTGVEVRLSSLSGSRKLVDVVFAFTDRKTDFVEKRFTRVDVTGKWPFLVTKMSPYYAR